MSDHTGACLKGVYGVAQPSLKALVPSRCRLLCIKLDYDDNIGKSNVFGTVAYSDEESAC